MHRDSLIISVFDEKIWLCIENREFVEKPMKNSNEGEIYEFKY